MSELWDSLSEDDKEHMLLRLGNYERHRRKGNLCRYDANTILLMVRMKCACPRYNNQVSTAEMQVFNLAKAIENLIEER